MTDKEIIKALECCITNKCDECAIYKECHNENGKGRVQVVLDLINRQQAEIERARSALSYQKDLVERMYQGHEAFVKHAKAEAIKEFAERFKKRIGFINVSNAVIKIQIDKLAKEMTEVSDG